MKSRPQIYLALAALLAAGAGLALPGPARAAESPPVDHMLLLSQETAPETLATLNPEQAAWLARRVLQRLHVLELQGVAPSLALDTALIRNSTPLTRREAMQETYVKLHGQVKAAGLFKPENAAWWKSTGAPPEGLPELRRILSREVYPQYATELVNFTLGDSTEADRAAALATLQRLPALGKQVVRTAPPAAKAPAAQEPPIQAEAPAAPQGPIISRASDSEVAGEGLSVTRTYTSPYGDVTEDQITGDATYAPSTGYYPPYYPPVYYPPVIPPNYERPEKPHRPHRRKSTVVIPGQGNSGETTYKAKVRDQPKPKPVPYDPATMTPEEYERIYGRRP